jgi:hypothetical protein
MCADIKEVKTMKLRDSTKQGDESSSHPPFSASLAPPYFHLFDLLKVALRGRRFADDDELNHNVSENLRQTRKEF